MKFLFVNLAAIVAVNIAKTVLKNSNDSTTPTRVSDQAPIGASRCGDRNSLEGTMSHWQLDPEQVHKFQL